MFSLPNIVLLKYKLNWTEIVVAVANDNGRQRVTNFPLQLNRITLEKCISNVYSVCRDFEDYFCQVYATFVELRQVLALLECNCSATEDDIGLGIIKVTDLLKAVQHGKFHGDVFHVVCELMFVAFVQRMEVVCEELLVCRTWKNRG